MQSQYYFAYGSNLALAQMRQRCPDSQFTGVGLLSGYSWIICKRGYANVVKDSDGINSKSKVWGLVFEVTAADVQLLDLYENVPYSYIKEDLEVDYWPASDSIGVSVDVQVSPQKLTTLVYVDINNVTAGDIKSEYVFRMANGLRDALNNGVPLNYIVQDLLPPIHAGKKYVGPLWDDYRDKDGNPVSDEVPTGSEDDLRTWLNRLLDKITDIPAWGSRGRPTLVGK
jgi:gamma-glutamylcyclotransferase